MKIANNLVDLEPDLGNHKYIRVILKEIETSVRIGLYEEEKKGRQICFRRITIINNNPTNFLYVFYSKPR